ncbi:MAG: hypothetical protein ACR2QK_20785 [Acidimicrobiales bacterium]
MFVQPELWLLEHRARGTELRTAADEHRLSLQIRPARARSHQLRSTTASALSAAAHLIEPPAIS